MSKCCPGREMAKYLPKSASAAVLSVHSSEKLREHLAGNDTLRQAYSGLARSRLCRAFARVAIAP